MLKVRCGTTVVLTMCAVGLLAGRLKCS